MVRPLELPASHRRETGGAETRTVLGTGISKRSGYLRPRLHLGLQNKPAILLRLRQEGLLDHPQFTEVRDWAVDVNLSPRYLNSKTANLFFRPKTGTLAPGRQIHVNPDRPISPMQRRIQRAAADRIKKEE